MHQFIEYIVKNLVDTPDDVNINCLEGQRGTIVEIRVNKGDIGKVVGKNGKTIQALRTIAMTVASRFNRRVRLELID
jgi:predicted RNA-binding protein YlqC (UPF0109 family)